MREINILANALVGEFGSAQRAADEARLVVRRARLGPGVRGLYLPARGGRRRGILLLGVGMGRNDREYLLLCALGHHFLRHRALPWYPYLESGPGYPDARARLEAAAFADAFARSLPRRRLTLVR